MALNDKFESVQKLLDATKNEEKKNASELAGYKEKLQQEANAKNKKAQKTNLEELEDYFVELRAAGIKLTSRQEQQLMQRAINKENLAKKKAQAEYWKTQSKQYEKQLKKEQKDADKELRIAQLRSQRDENDQIKSFSRKIKDTVKAKFLEGTSIDLGKGLKDNFDKLTKALGSLQNAVNNAMSQYASYQTGINARLQGSDKTFSKIEKSLSTVAYSPLLRADDLYNNLATLIRDGIVSNVEQRAFLMTIKDNIATTFDANNASIKRIIRLQQQDSTASRLGMEAFLTRYMNQMVQNTEYLTTSFDNVQSALLEASSLMNMNRANEFEYQVQKWLGTMTGLGLSESTSSSIAQALGYLGSGNIESLGSSALQNLLVMSASRAGLNYSEMLKGGLSGSTTNQLLASIVTFVKDMWDTSKDNNIVLSQLSNTFGLTVSDVRAIANMSKTLQNSLTQTNLTTSQMYGELGYQFNQMAGRMSIATILENAFKNFEFQTGATLASNPATYALWKIADFIGSTTSGINIPHATVLGTGVDLNTTVDNLLKLGLVGVSTLSNIPNIVKAISSLGNGASLLSAMGINEGTSIISRGASLSTNVSGFTTSQSAYIANTNQQAYQQSASMMMKEQQQAAIQENENKEEITLNTINTNMVEKLDSIITILGDTGIRIADSSIEGFSNAMKTPI